MQEFLNKIRKERAVLVSNLTTFKAQGKTIVGYGAPAKATTLLSFFGIADMIDFIAEDAPLKVGRFMPGSHIPIVPSEVIYKYKPDYVLILVWNFADDIMAKLQEGGYKGKCIVPFR